MTTGIVAFRNIVNAPKNAELQQTIPAMIGTGAEQSRQVTVDNITR